MRAYRTRALCTLFLFCLLCLSACSSSSPPQASKEVPPPVSITQMPTIAPPTPKPTIDTSKKANTAYRSHLLHKGDDRPDDMALDNEGRLLFSDVYHGTVSRLNKDGSVSVIVAGIAEPEGIIVLPDNTLIISEQQTNRILSFAPGSRIPTVLRSLPGENSEQQCKAGIDNISLDTTTHTVLVPNSSTGDLYRMSLDGQKLTLIASGMKRPVGAVNDAQGNIYVADECGGAVLKIDPKGHKSKLGGFGMPDDVALDRDGNLLVVDLKQQIHSLIRVDLKTGKHETLDAKPFNEPQGLLVTPDNRILVSDDNANLIMEYTPL